MKYKEESKSAGPPCKERHPNNSSIDQCPVSVRDEIRHVSHIRILSLMEENTKILIGFMA